MKRSFERITRRRPALHERLRVPACASGASGVARRARSPRTSCASARRSTRCCASSRSRSSPTARAPGGSAASSCAAAPSGAAERGGARGRQLAAGQVRAPRRRPELGPDRCRRPAQALPGTAPLAARHRDRGRAGRARRSAAGASTPASSPRRCAATRSSTSSRLPGEGAETELFFSDLGHELRDAQRGVLDVSATADVRSPRCSSRSRTSGSSSARRS